MKKAVLIASGLALLLLVGGYLYFVDREYVLRFSEEDIRQTLAEKTPVTKTYLLVIQVTLDNPRVELHEGSTRVNAGMDVALNVTVYGNSEPLSGSIDASGGIRYVAEEGAFYMTEPVVDDLQVQGLSDDTSARVSVALTTAISEYFSDAPIYRLRSTDTRHAVAKMVLKDVVVEDQHLVIRLGI